MTHDSLISRPLTGNPLESHADLERAARDLLRQSVSGNDWAFLADLGIDLGLDLDKLDSSYLGDGWYRDDDHAATCAKHICGLIYSKQQSGDDERAERYRDRARRFAQDFRHWFDDQGGVLGLAEPLVSAGFWAALAYAGVEALPWGEIKGFLLRHLRWCGRHPTQMPEIDTADPTSLALRVFLPLVLPDSHPFWQAKELPASPGPEATPLRHPGLVMMRTAGNVLALSSCQGTSARFAAASRYRFGTEVDQGAALDSMIGFSDDNRRFRVREADDVALIAGDCLYGRWRPWDDVIVETWLVPENPWHMRVHRVITSRRLITAESGFAISHADLVAAGREEGHGLASVRSKDDIGLIVDLSEGPKRKGRCFQVPSSEPAKAIVPQLFGEIFPGTTILAAAILALPASAAAEQAAKRPPEAPSLFALEALFKVKGERVTGLRI